MTNKNLHIVIFTQNACSYCSKAKDLLKSLGHKYEEINFDLLPHFKLKFKAAYPTLKKVPQIFVDTNHVGGYEDLKEAVLEAKTYDPLLSYASDHKTRLIRPEEATLWAAVNSITRGKEEKVNE